ncbi:MAG: ATP:cob(I)alamin adenosyltransferase [Treponema sp.]|jgi:cob(I)alamin adenosyltransferase|nr:ATP:cob(I)alamin adenosyltransferase [Treponema sp.]
MGIVTGTGDGGFTDLGGARVPKDDPRIEALGVLDELDAFLAGSRAALAEEPLSGATAGLAGIIDRVREDLAETVMPFLAGADRLIPKLQERTADLESRIAVLEEQRPADGFFYSWTRPGAVKLNIARTICRRAERRAAACAPGPACVFLNRLSDLLFLAALAAERRGGSA